MKAKLLLSIFIFFLVSFGFSQSKSSKNKYQWSWGEFTDEVESSSVSASSINPEIYAILFPETKNSSITEKGSLIQSSTYPNPSLGGGIVTISVITNESDLYKIAVYDSKGKQQVQLFEGILEKGKEIQLEVNSQKLEAGYSYVRISSKNGYSHVSKLFIIK